MTLLTPVFFSLAKQSKHNSIGYYFYTHHSATASKKCNKGCTCGDNCKCGADCKCEKVAACNKGCKCGDNCKCGPDCKCEKKVAAAPVEKCTRGCTCGGKKGTSKFHHSP